MLRPERLELPTPAKAALVLHFIQGKTWARQGTTSGSIARWETVGNVWKSQKAITNRLLYQLSYRGCVI